MKITALCEIYSGVSFPKKPIAEDEGNFFVMESLAVDALGDINSSALKLVSNQQYRMSSNYLVDGDVLLRAKGSTHSAILFNDRFDLPVVPSSYFLILRLKEKRMCSSEFLTCLLNHSLYQRRLSELAGGATIQHLTKKRLSSLELVIPTPEVQELIVQLSEQQKIEALLERKLTSLREELYEVTTAKFLEKRK